MRISDWSSDVCSSDLRLAFRSHIGLGRNDFPADVLQSSRGILNDTREAFLGGDQLHFQHGDLLITPPAERAKAEEQGQHHDTQRRLAHLVSSACSATFLAGALVLHRLTCGSAANRKSVLWGRRG